MKKIITQKMFLNKMINCGSPLGPNEVHLEDDEVMYILSRLPNIDEPRTDDVIDRGNQID